MNFSCERKKNYLLKFVIKTQHDKTQYDISNIYIDVFDLSKYTLTVFD